MTYDNVFYSEESEQSVIGGLLIGGEVAWDRVADIVVESDFYRDDHRKIFAQIRKLFETSNPVDVVTVADALAHAGIEYQTGGIGYLGEIAHSTPSAANIASYAKSVAEQARRRAFIEVAGEVTAVATRQGTDDAQTRIDSATGMLLALAERGSAKDEPRAISQVLGRVIESIEQRFNRGGDISGLRTGFSDIDKMLDGLKGGDLIIVAGRPSMGKTALAINIAENVAVAGTPVLVFSLEMGDEQLVMRTLSSVGGINSRVLASGAMNDDEWERVSAALSKLHEAPLIIDQSANLSVAQMRARSRRQKRKGGLGLIVIDYLQLMSAGGNNRNEELGEITRGLKLMARDLNVPVICLSQLSRKCEERTDKRPLLSDLRESGSIEQDADVAMMIYRDEYYNQDSQYKGFAEVLVRKNRMGACGEVALVFQAEYSRFRDADQSAIANAHRMAAESRSPRRRRGFEE